MKLFGVYRVLAFVVGTLLVVCTLISLAKYSYHLFPAMEGTTIQRLGVDLSILWMPHGMLYMAYALVTLLLAVRARWSMQFTVLAFAAGLVPLLMFWVERQVEHKVRTETPELV